MIKDNQSRGNTKRSGTYGKEKATEEGKSNANGNHSGNKRNNKKFKGKRDRFDKDYNPKINSSNDASWYARDPNLLAAAASFPFTWPTGNAIDLGPYASKIHLGSVPGIMAISIDPQVGWADNFNSPITLAAREEYAFVRYANSGHNNYDDPDLMMYHIAMDSCYSYFSFLKRIYGVCRTYSNVNRYYPKGLIEAMGVDFEDIMKNLANLNYAINVFATMFSRLNVPAGMPYVTKHMWMYENIYTDANTPRGQTYMFVPRSLYQYGYDTNGAGKLTRLVLDNNFNSYIMNKRTYDELVQTMYDLLNPVIADEDIGTISGDILKAYGDGGIMKVSGVDFTYGITPVYNLEVLEIINNLTLLGPSTGDITQEIDVNTGWIKSMPTFEHFNPDLVTDTSPGMNALSCDRFINFKRDNITPADSMVVTRMMNIADPDSYNPLTHQFTCKTIGSETAAFARVFWFGRATDQASDPWILKWTNPFTMSIAYAIESVSNIVGAEGALAANDVASAQTFVNNGAKIITDSEIGRAHV